jgi:hypothetical protein
MRTLLFSNQGLSPSHLGVELEIIENEIKHGNELSILYCKSNLQSCFFNASHNILACAICEGRSKVFYDKIGFPKSKLKALKILVTNFDIHPIKDIDDIFSLRYKNYDIGRGIAASYISTRRNYEFQIEDEEFIKEMAIMCANVIENIEHQINFLKLDNIILFNGRFAEQNAIIEVCQKHNIDYSTFEKSSAQGKYKFFKNMLPHSLTSRAIEIKRLWEYADPILRAQIGKEWFDNRQKKSTGLVKKFLAKQVNGVLPEAFDNSKTNIAFFIGSEDEHKALKEYHFKHYSNQNEAITTIIKHYKDEENICFHLRVHPHLQKIDSSQMNEIRNFKFSNLNIIHADEKVDTYELMRACDKVISFGSTTGIEATFVGVPSILFGHSYFESTDCVYLPQDYAELYHLVSTKNLKPKPVESTYPFAFYQSTVGIPFNKFKEGGKSNSFFDSTPIKRVYPKTLFIFIRNINFLSQWSKMNKIILKEPISIKNMFKLNSHVFNEKLK